MRVHTDPYPGVVPAPGDSVQGGYGPVAVVGIGCRFPGGIEDRDSFWDVLATGTDAIGDIPADRWRNEAYFDPDPATPGRTHVRQGGFLRSPVDRFDAGFFGMTPRDAAALDPQQRLLLEVTWEAFEDAGIPPVSTAGARVGTYIGAFTFDAALVQLSEANRHLVSTATPTGMAMTMLSARLSHAFDWRGPCLTIDTACSSSLVALHHACAALASGDCDVAVAGGANVMVGPAMTIMLSKGGFLSPDARCRSFDHRANGYARAEGAGIVVLKPLAAAERDGDRIHAVIRGSAVNQDGRTPGITVPSAAAQRAVIGQTCRAAGVDPRSIGYFEAHGTGTAVGDPIEASSIGEMLAGSAATHWIGSVKSNLGHTEAAAGMAGVIKAILCLDRGLIPPNIHFERPNPAIPFDRLPIRVPVEMTPFGEYGGPRRAGVNSFGFGGTNAHALLEQAPPLPRRDPTADADGQPQLLPLSARSPQALRALVDAYADLLDKPDAPTLRRVCRAVSRQREHHPLRAFVVAGDPAGAARQLRQLTVAPRRATPRPVAFVYTGMGPQWWGMGRELLRHEPLFAETVAECDRFLARFGLSIADELLRDEAESRLTSTLYAQVGNFVVQAGLTALWRSWGVEPAMIVGHSVGEVAAAYAAGVYSLPDALTVSFHRANLQSRLAGRGAMAAVDLPAGAVGPYLVDGVDVAAINSATATTLAGDAEALETVSERLRAAGVAVKALRVEVAYHSAQMDEIHQPLLAALADIRPAAAGIPLYSTVTGGRVDGTGFDAGYWWRNVRQPVRFADAVRELLAAGPGAVLEVGPHPVLASAINEALAEQDGDPVQVASLRRDRPQREHLRQALGTLYAAGVEVDWKGVHPGPREHLDLPRYPWQRDAHWIESAVSRSARLGGGGLRLAGREVPAATPTRDVELSAAEFPYLVDHRIGDDAVFPGAGYLEAALAMFPDDTPCFLADVVFHRPLPVRPATVATLRTNHDPVQRTVTMHSREPGDDNVWTLHAELRRPDLVPPGSPPPRGETLAELTRDLPELTRDDLYARLADRNLHYGPAFRAVRRVWHREETGEIFAALEPGPVDTDGYRLHPALLDAALHATIGGAVWHTDEGGYVPARIAELRLYRTPGTGGLWVHGRDRRSAVDGWLECDLTILTDDGDVVAEVVGLRAQRTARPESDRPDPPESRYYRPVWHLEPAEGVGTLAGTWLVVGGAETQALVRGLTGRGATVRQVATGRPDWPDEVRAVLADEPACRGVVHLDGTPAADAPACEPVAVPLRLVQALPADTVPLVLVTVGAQSVDEDDPTTDPFAASVWGLGRVVNAERPELRCRLVDTDHTEQGMAALLDELARESLDEVVLRAGRRYVRRLEPADDRSPLHHLRTATDRTPVTLRTADRDLDRLRFVAVDRPEPGPTEVEIEVAYVGLNFKDVLKATGLLSAEAMTGSYSESTLGLECSGTIVRVGRAVTDLRPGDEVLAHGRDLFTSHVTLDQVRVVRKPAGLSLAEAASLLPVVTAHQALVRLARVQPTERVLVHSAAGGVGLAAVRLARWLGAQVYATAGSEQRREFLRGEGVAGISDSRSIAFVDDIRSATGGEGVDVVVNSLPGEILHQSLGLLRPFGRFVEVGKADIAANHSLRLAPFHRALSFHAFDYDQMMRLAPEVVRAAMAEVAALYDKAEVVRLPVTEMPAGQVGAAFRAMTRREHLGKIVVRMADEPVTVPAASITDAPVRPDASYLVTGGLGGLGLTVARWLADQGARHLVLVGRRGIATAEAAGVVDRLTGAGVQVRVEQVDVADRTAVRDLLDRVRTQLSPVRGVVHAAAGFDDAVLAETDAARLVAATRPKADGAWNLHLATETDQLDFFVLFSSFAAQIGPAAGGAYVSANEFLNGLARYRRARGLPALSVGWGMVDQVGVAVDNDGAVGRVLRRNGQLGMTPGQLVEALGVLLRTRPAEACVAGVDWAGWARANPQLAGLPRYAALVPVDVADDPGQLSVPERLRAATDEERRAMLPALVAPLLGRITGLSEEQLGDEHAVDIDSLAGVELRVLLQNSLGVSVPAVRLQRNLTVAGLVGLLAGEWADVPPPTGRPADAVPAAVGRPADPSPAPTGRPADASAAGPAVSGDPGPPSGIRSAEVSTAVRTTGPVARTTTAVADRPLAGSLTGATGQTLAGRTVLITGGSRGLGRAFAEEVGRAGAHVVITGRDADALDRARDQMRAEGSTVDAFVADVAQRGATAGVVRSVVETHGGLDVMVNNAGVSGPIGPMWEVDEDEWSDTIEVNLRGTMLGCRAALAVMVPRGVGRVINVVSHAGRFRWPYLSAYSVSKAAVIKLTENLADELRTSGVVVLSYHPGLVDLGITRAGLDRVRRGGGDRWERLTAQWGEQQLADGQMTSVQRAATVFRRLVEGAADDRSGAYLTVDDDIADGGTVS
ncbi:type I polyketide synthase [Micromonospora yangpuensis]|uniref:Acyl transferase domain-containing protein n=1 Tax=Micromonospora yangpuensis TaxID=683228 RepID=A0A1C6UVR0_9ACTN|nr:type I polyketide synthase [Micromonospora yangpuensis]GGM26017.1 polyketide synthase [Micromonospora yangpuensis]SCL58046.1 Acyl transferase domain-containing protein [Micromonospora yangpuensis]